MSILSVLKASVVTLALVTGAPLFAQGTPINAAAFDSLVAQGPVADAATIASNKWASKIKQAGMLRLGGTQTSNLFSMLNEKDGKMRGFDAGLAQLLTRYILGDASKYKFTQVTSSTREQVLVNDQVDMVLATYSITPARAEKISFAGPYYTSQAACWSSPTTRPSSRTTISPARRPRPRRDRPGPRSLRNSRPRRSCRSSRHTRKPSTPCARDAWTRT